MSQMHALRHGHVVINSQHIIASRIKHSLRDVSDASDVSKRRPIILAALFALEFDRNWTRGGTTSEPHG